MSRNSSVGVVIMLRAGRSGVRIHSGVRDDMTRDTNTVKNKRNTVEPGYNDIGLYDTSLIESDILWYQLIPRC
jgi:hypothetical protein